MLVHTDIVKKRISRGQTTMTGSHYSFIQSKPSLTLNIQDVPLIYIRYPKYISRTQNIHNVP